MLALLQQAPIFPIPLDKWVESVVRYITDNFRPLFTAVRGVINAFVGVLDAALNAPPELVMLLILTVIAFLLAGWRIAVFTLVGFFLLMNLQAGGRSLWEPAMTTLALVLASTAVSLIIGVPLGILAAKSRSLEAGIKPVLDIMQTMPAFVYLVPIVVLLGLAGPPALVATVIFSMPPAVRLTMLGIQQVPSNTVEAAQAFGATPWQTLRKVELPQALPTIMAGVNQVIMLALSMVVVAGLVGFGGLGQTVVQGLQQLNVGLAFISGLGIVIIAIYLDRVSRNLGRLAQRTKASKGSIFTRFLPRRKEGLDDPSTAGAAS